MSLVITIAREFSSGGRELGRRIADELHIAYYDKEILQGIQEKTPYSMSYIEEVSEHRPIVLPPINYGSSFSLYPDVSLQQSIDVHTAQIDLIKEYAQKSDCVIIGRGADYTLRDLHPFRIFVYSDMDSKIERCRQREAKDSELNDKQLAKKINAINKKRRDYYEYYTGRNWGDKENYDLMINTSHMNIKEIAHNLATLIKQIQETNK
jgi:cytidylate kinase